MDITEKNRTGFVNENYKADYGAIENGQFPGNVAVQPQGSSDEGIIGVPPGLEYLLKLDQLLVHQMIEMFEALTGFQTENKYVVKNSMGQQCYFIAEESGFCMRLCCGNFRGFYMHISDNMGREVIRVYRKLRCAGCCWCINGDCCAFMLHIESPVGTPIGRIVQLCSGWKPKYAVQNEFQETMLIIQGPCCMWSGPCCTCDVELQVLTADESECIGSIAREYAGFAQEMFTNATNFVIRFPMDLDVKMKASILVATLLIDMMFYERKNKK